MANNVPAGTAELYHTAEQWRDFRNIVEMDYIITDVNEDGAVDVGDVNTVLAAILNNDSRLSLDVNGDNNVDVGDVNTILNTILNK